MHCFGDVAKRQAFYVSQRDELPVVVRQILKSLSQPQKGFVAGELLAWRSHIARDLRLQKTGRTDNISLQMLLQSQVTLFSTQKFMNVHFRSIGQYSTQPSREGLRVIASEMKDVPVGGQADLLCGVRGVRLAPHRVMQSGTRQENQVAAIAF